MHAPNTLLPPPPLSPSSSESSNTPGGITSTLNNALTGIKAKITEYVNYRGGYSSLCAVQCCHVL